MPAARLWQMRISKFRIAEKIRPVKLGIREHIHPVIQGRRLGSNRGQRHKHPANTA
jgi:hypothetical protein